MKQKSIKIGIKKKLWFFGSILLLVFLASALITFIKVEQVSTLSNRIAKVRSVSMAEGSRLKTGIVSSANNLRGYIITKDPKFAEGWSNIWSKDIEPALANLSELRSSWTSRKNKERFDSILKIIPQFKAAQTKAVELVKNNIILTEQSKVLSLSLNDTAKLAAANTLTIALAANEKSILSIFTKGVAPKFSLLNSLSGALSNSQLDLLNADTKSSEEIMSDIKMINITLSIIGAILILALMSLLFISNTRYIELVKSTLLNISKGKVHKEDSLASDGDMAELAEPIKALSCGIKKTSEFAMEIGKGNLNAEFTPLSEEDTLGISLLNMRANLKNVHEEEQKRIWTNQGLAKFAEILREQNKSTNELCDSIIANLIKYMNANQGALYVVNEDDTNNEYLELAACYAWNRKKHHRSKIEKGEGLVGQTWQEGEKIFLTDVPENFIRITSGLGDANPRCIYISPLKINERTYGVLEIASFKKLEAFEMEFIEKLSESIASVLSSAKINDRTRLLLQQSQSQTEELRAQEEEMRQGLEEMHATQEEMQRILHKNSIQKQGFEQTLNHASIGIVILNSGKEITFFNSAAEKLLGYTTIELAGKHIKFILPDSFRENSAANEQEYEVISKSGSKFWARINLVKLNADVEDQTYVLFIADITDVKLNNEKISKLQAVQSELNARLNLINDSCIVSETDLKGVITNVNDKFCEVYKYSREELLGKPHNVIRHPDMPSSIFSELWSTISRGEIFRTEIKNRAKDGSSHWADTLIAPVFEANGEASKYICIRYDISEKKFQEKNMKENLLAN